MLKLSKKGSYAIRAMVFIGKESSKIEILKIDYISEQLGISNSLLRRIISELEKGGLILSIKGRNGGVKLLKELNKISIYDILLSVGEEMNVIDCTRGESCDKILTCDLSKIYFSLERGLHSLLKMYTLDKII